MQEQIRVSVLQDAIQPKIYSTRGDAKTEIFNFIEMFYNPISGIAILKVCLRPKLKKIISPN
jgi:hypothetical protein|tara:strand:+ start:142 stop:327 length:186 start_codon:yes stop_codon:yes gene_type:complete